MPSTTTDFKHEHLLSNHAKSRILKRFWSSVDLPEGATPHPKPIQLIGGVPNHGFFPVNSINVNLSRKPFPKGYITEEIPDETVDQFDHFFQVPQVTSDPKEIDLKFGLQYAETEGLGPLLEFTRQFIARVNPPNYSSDDWDTIMSCGGSNGIDKAFDALLDKGDTVLVEEFTFTPILGTIDNLECTAVPIKMTFDESGKLEYAPYLRNLLENWTSLKPGLPKPKVLYCIPNGHNPIGIQQSWEHKKLIYELAVEFDFMIIEDDPYGYLSFTKSTEPPNFELTNDEFINSLGNSMLQMDYDGRIIRIETFSKIFAPGLRLGFVVAHKRIIKVISDYANVGVRAPSGLSQLFVNNTILKLGGLEGWLKWIISVRNEYLTRKNTFVKSLQSTEACSKGYLKIIEPDAGMFVCPMLDFKSFGKDPSQFEQFMELFKVKCVVHGVGVVFGGAMSVDSEFSKERCNFIRIAICATSNLDMLDEFSSRLSNAVIDLFKDLQLVTML